MPADEKIQVPSPVGAVDHVRLKPRRHTWFVPFGSQELRAPDHDYPDVEPIVADAQPVTVTLSSIMAARIHHAGLLGRFKREGNNLLIKSSAAIGREAQVPRVHDFRTNVPAKKVLKDLLADTICFTPDYRTGESLWLHIELLEVDKNEHQTTALRETVKTLAQTAGAVFPPAALYAAGSDALFRCVTLLRGALEQNTAILDVDVRLHGAREGGAQLRPGHYVVFGEEVHGAEYFLDDVEVYVRPTDSRTEIAQPDIDYVVFSVRIRSAPSPDYVAKQEVAALLVQLENDQKSASTQGFDRLTSALNAHRSFADIQRYHELRQLGSERTEAQTALMQQLARKESLRGFLKPES